MWEDRNQRQGRVQVRETAGRWLGSPGPGVAGPALVPAMGNQEVAVPSRKSGPPEFTGLGGKD